MDGLQHPMASYIVDLCAKTVGKYDLQFSPDCVSIAKVVETVNYASRDLSRISHDLGHKVSRQKYAAYYAFWFAKLAPLSNVRRKDMNGIEVVDINERVAVEIAVDLMANSIGVPEVPDDIEELEDDEALKIGSRKAPVPLVWQKCNLDCAGECFKTGIRRYLTYHHYQNFEYVVHSLRHRGIGPYFLVGILESAVLNSCESKQDFHNILDDDGD